MCSSFPFIVAHAVAGNILNALVSNPHCKHMAELTRLDKQGCGLAPDVVIYKNISPRRKYGCNQCCVVVCSCNFPVTFRVWGAFGLTHARPFWLCSAFAPSSVGFPVTTRFFLVTTLLCFFGHHRGVLLGYSLLLLLLLLYSLLLLLFIVYRYYYILYYYYYYIQKYYYYYYILYYY